MFSIKPKLVNSLVILILLAGGNLFAQKNFEWQRELVSKVAITDQEVIKKLAYELLIPEVDIDYIEIFDIDDKGAAEGDLLKVHPSQNVYKLFMLTKECRNILDAIPPNTNEHTTGKMISIKKEDSKTAEEKILYTLATVIMKLYGQDQPLKLYFEQLPDGYFIFELLGYSEEMMDDTKDFSFGGDASTEHVQDLLKALYQDLYQETFNWQPMAIHVVKTVRDTIYVPEKQKKKR